MSKSAVGDPAAPRTKPAHDLRPCAGSVPRGAGSALVVPFGSSPKPADHPYAQAVPRHALAALGDRLDALLHAGEAVGVVELGEAVVDGAADELGVGDAEAVAVVLDRGPHLGVEAGGGGVEGVWGRHQPVSWRRCS